jgi:hypothetical protein
MFVVELDRTSKSLLNFFINLNFPIDLLVRRRVVDFVVGRECL